MNVLQWCQHNLCGKLKLSFLSEGLGQRRTLADRKNQASYKIVYELLWTWQGANAVYVVFIYLQSV
jgi:hypothetical protein